MIRRVLLFVVIAAILVLVLLYSQWTTGSDAVSGVVEAHSVRIGSRVGGRVARVLAIEGQTVKTNDVLIELEPYDLAQRAAGAKYDLAAADAEYAKLVAGFRAEEIAETEARREQLVAERDKLVAGPRSQEIAAAKARRDAAESELRLAKQTLNRVERLRNENASTQEELEQAQERHEAALSAIAVRREELDLLESGTRAEDIRRIEAELAAADAALALRKAGYREEEIAFAKAKRDAAEAALEAFHKQIEELTIRAPCDGVVEAVEIRAGDLISPNAPILSILETNELWMRAYVPSNRLDIKIGQIVDIVIDSFPGETFAGEVSYVSRDSEFTPSNAQTAEERVKRVYRIKVALRDANRLRPGMTGEVRLKSHE